MARIDFSNATISCIYSTMFNNESIAYLGMGENNFVTSSKVIQNGKTNITNVSEHGFTIIKSGTVLESGNKIFLRTGNTNRWVIENITFDAGDTFDFQINVRIN